ncbi:MAG: PilZ domain-containing protein [Minicystis sp.]
MNRRSLTPPVGTPSPGLPLRRAGGARRNVSYRVSFFRDPAGDGRSPTEIPGWALNISRGGLRAIVEDRVELGEELDIDIAEEGLRHRGRIVWTQEEPDGMIVGVSFLERLTEPPAGVELDASVEFAPGALAEALEMTEAEAREALAPPEPGERGPSDGGRG